jgi:hypothetical protein
VLSRQKKGDVSAKEIENSTQRTSFWRTPFAEWAKNIDCTCFSHMRALVYTYAFLSLNTLSLLGWGVMILFTPYFSSFPRISPVVGSKE